MPRGCPGGPWDAQRMPRVYQVVLGMPKVYQVVLGMPRWCYWRSRDARVVHQMVLGMPEWCTRWS